MVQTETEFCQKRELNQSIKTQRWKLNVSSESVKRRKQTRFTGEEDEEARTEGLIGGPDTTLRTFVKENRVNKVLKESGFMKRSGIRTSDLKKT